MSSPQSYRPGRVGKARAWRSLRVAIPDELERTETLRAAVKNGVKVLAVSHIHWRTGTRVDLVQLSAHCRKHGCRLIVDGVQAIGAVPVRAAIVDCLLRLGVQMAAVGIRTRDRDSE